MTMGSRTGGYRAGRPAAILVAAILVAGILSVGLLATAGAAGADNAGPQRIVSVGGAVTETVFALGAGDRVVAVDSTSLYPPEARHLPDLGYMRTLSAEALLSLSPDRILAVEGSGPPNVLDQIRAAGADLVMIPGDPSPEGVAEKVRAVGAALAIPAQGEELALRLEREFAALAQVMAGLEARPKVLFLLSISGGAPPQAAGGDTAADGIIALAGGRNAVRGYDGYRPLSPEAMVAVAPEVILVTSQGLEVLGGPDAVLARPEIAATPAGREGRLLAMDALLLLGFGPRTPEAARMLARELHPGLGSDTGLETLSGLEPVTGSERPAE